ncbi:MAG: LacI family DNA-binding transcriptional regulator [Cyclobacteriaceae bacterium]
MPVGITLKELAEKIGVSRTTVSRVMSGNAIKYRISESTINKVRKAADKYRLVPNQVAKNLRRQKTDTIGLMIPDVSNPFFANLAKGVEDALRMKGKMILLCNTNENTAQESELLSMIVGRQIDGLLVAPVGLDGSHFKSLSDKPIVFIDRYFDDLDIPYVATHNVEGGYQATRYLVERGHQHIACIQGLVSTVSSRDRVLGVKKALHEFGKKADSVILGDGFTIENGIQAMNQLLDSPIRPTAVFAMSNQIAIGAMDVIKSRGLQIPKDVSLISFDEQPYFKLTSPPVTTIQQPIELLAKTAVKMLMELISGNAVSSTAIMPKIIERESVAVLQ